jgi:hypothetical protein
MAENQDGFDGYLEKLAVICDAIDELHQGKKIIVFELDRENFVKIRKELKTVGDDKDEFKIDISGNEFIYLLNE